MIEVSLTDDPDLNVVPSLDWSEEIEKMERPVVIDLGRVDGYVRITVDYMGHTKEFSKITVDYMGHPKEISNPLAPKFKDPPLESRVAVVRIQEGSEEGAELSQ